MSEPWYEQEQHQQRYWSYDAIHDFLYYAISEIDKLCREHSLHYYLAYGTLLGAVRDGTIIPWDPDGDIYIPAQELMQFIECARKYLPDDLYVDFYDTNPSYIYTFPRIGKKGFTTNGLHLDVFLLVGLPTGKNEKKYLRKYEWKRVEFGIIQGNWSSRLQEIDCICQNKFFRKCTQLLKKVLNKNTVIKKMEKLASQYNIFDEDNFVFDGVDIFKSNFFKEGADVDFAGIFCRVPSDSDSYLKQCYKEYTVYPGDKCFQSIIRSDYVRKDILYNQVAYISDFLKMDLDQYKVIEKAYWKSGSVVAVVDTRKINCNDLDLSVKIAKSIKFFDKVFTADSSEKIEKHLKMINPDYVIDAMRT